MKILFLCGRWDAATNTNGFVHRLTGASAAQLQLMASMELDALLIAGQAVVFTTPHIGNVGINPDDDEAGTPALAAAVVRSLSPVVSNWRATGTLTDWLQHHGVPGISGVNTPHGSKTRADGARIRALAVMLKIPYVATISAAAAAVMGIKALKEKGLTFTSLQQIYRSAKLQSIG